MNFRTFADKVNAIEARRVEKMNVEFVQGKRLFGASFHEFPDSMLRSYYEAGLTPVLAHRKIITER